MCLPVGSANASKSVDPVGRFAARCHPPGTRPSPLTDKAIESLFTKSAGCLRGVRESEVQAPCLITVGSIAPGSTTSRPCQERFRVTAPASSHGRHEDGKNLQYKE
jgi:hypothetical protein